MRDDNGKKIIAAWATCTVMTDKGRKDVITLFESFPEPWEVVGAQLAAGRHPTKYELREAFCCGSTIPQDIESKVHELMVEVIDSDYPKGLKKLSYYTDRNKEQGERELKKAKIVQEVVTQYAHDGRGTLDAIYAQVAEKFHVSVRTVKGYYLNHKNGD